MRDSKESKTNELLDEFAQRLFVIEDRLEKMHVTLQLSATLLEAVRHIVLIHMPLPDVDERSTI
jgi:hypothetical protein